MKEDKGNEETQKATAESTVSSVEDTVKFLTTPITKALYNALYELDESSRAIVLGKAGRACAQAVRAYRESQGLEYPRGVDLNTACEFLERAAHYDERLKREYTCKRDGDWVEIRDAICELLGSCSCILVLGGLVEPNDTLCSLCQEGHWTEHFEYMTGQRPDKFEFPESHCMGGHCCVARCHFKPAK